MNVIVVMADSLRLDYTPCGTSKARAVTPRIEAFANQSAVFEDFFTEALPTLPARRVLFTGKKDLPFPKRKNRFIADGELWGWYGLYDHDVPLAETLRDHDFTTGLIANTYHLFKPTMNFHFGFDSFIWMRGHEIDKYKAPPVTEQMLAGYDLQKCVPFLPFFLQNIMDWKGEEDHFTPQLFGEVDTWLAQHKDCERFFLWIDSFSPHQPWVAPEEYTRPYDNGAYTKGKIIWPMPVPREPYTEEAYQHMHALYAGEVALFDKYFGRMLDTVDQLGLADDTAVILLSDHGYMLGERGLIGKGPDALYPELVHVPLMVRLPGQRESRRISGLCQHTDLAQSILEMTGTTHKTSGDSRSLYPLLTGNGQPVRDYIVTGMHDTYAYHDAACHLIWNAHGKVELYHLANDPGAMTNVAEKYPDQVASLIKKIKAHLEAER